MAAMGQVRLSCPRPCRQPIQLALPRRADLAVLCRGSDELRRKSRFSFRYRKGLVSLGFRKLLEKAHRAVHRAQPAIQAVAQAEQQVCFQCHLLLLVLICQTVSLQQLTYSGCWLHDSALILKDEYSWHIIHMWERCACVSPDCLCRHQQAEECHQLPAVDSARQGLGAAEYPGKLLVTRCLEA